MKGDYMRKKFLGLVTLLLATSLVACGANGGNSQESKPAGDNSTSSQVTPAKRYTVKFMNGDVRVATESVKEGESLTAAQIHTVAAPEGHLFEGWSLTANGEVVDLTTYVVNADVTLYAVFKEAEDSGLSVDDKKEEGKTYYMVLGWWETTDKEADGSPKITSHLTKTTVRLFYQNLINYLKASGATDADINNIQFRNYSSGPVADMGAMINADGDVDLMIGVGNNINSTAGVKLHNESNDYKFQTPMGDGTARYVACLSTASELGVSTYSWLKNTDAGIASFVRELTEAEIKESLKPVDLDFTVKVHGDEVKETVLHTKDDVVEMPAITIPNGKNFKGFALSADGEVVLNKATDAKLKYDDLKDLVAEGVKTIDLYPVFEDKPVVLDDLVVYIQTGSKLSEAEAKLLEARFKETLTDKQVRFETNNGDSTAFTTFIEGRGDADVLVGGNTPLKNYTLKDATNYPLVNAGAKHFADGSRKVIIPATVADGHYELAKALYNFVKADATEYEFHYSFWSNNNKWTTEAERTTMTAAIETNVKTYLGIKEGETLADKYNVKITTYLAAGTKVADLGTETKALRDGKGTDLVIGCGGNIDATSGTTAGMTTVAKKPIGAPFVAADNRYVALIHENPLARNVYETYFVEQQPGE